MKRSRFREILKEEIANHFNGKYGNYNTDEGYEIIIDINKLNISDKLEGNAYKIAKLLSPDQTNIYDFGGGIHNYLDQSKSTVIDLYNTPEHPHHIKKDLNNIINLNKKKVIIFQYSFYNINNLGNIKKTIDNSLENGGYLIIRDYPNILEKVENLFSDYKLVYRYILKDWDEDEENGYFTEIFKK